MWVTILPLYSFIQDSTYERGFFKLQLTAARKNEEQDRMYQPVK